MKPRVEEGPRPSLGATGWEGSLPASPWTGEDLHRLVLTSLVGGGCILAAWVGASGTPVVTRTIAWAGLAVTGLVVTIAAMTMWLLQALRGVRLASRTALRAGAGNPDPASSSSGPGGRLVSAQGLSYVHRADCLLVRGKTTRAGREGELPSCPVCAS